MIHQKVYIRLKRHRILTFETGQCCAEIGSSHKLLTLPRLDGFAFSKRCLPLPGYECTNTEGIKQIAYSFKVISCQRFFKRT